MNKRKETIKYLAKQIRSLPEEGKEAIWWLLENIELVDEITQGKKFTTAEINELKK